MKTKVLMLCGILATGACLAWVLPSTDSANTTTSPTDPVDFRNYWFAGEAEITSYHLKQARYGEMRQGEAVLVFVTEPFNPFTQVKSDRGGGLDVLKCNFTRSFNTGIYPYSMMTSSFLPLKDGMNLPEKITTSSQEWCGHTFTQLNREDEGFRFRQYSYFESEGDVDKALTGDLLPEDALWNMIRKDPASIPTGELKMIPGTQYLRLSHVPAKPVKASIKRKDEAGKASQLVVDYTDINRQLIISYNPDFPHEIQGWEETYRSGFGSNAREMTTIARLNKRIKSDYWNRNANADSGLREELGLH